jgi:hypothetical protein
VKGKRPKTGASSKSRRARKETPRPGAPRHWVCTRAPVGYDLRVALDLSLRGSDWAPSVRKAPANTSSLAAANRPITVRPQREQPNLLFWPFFSYRKLMSEETEAAIGALACPALKGRCVAILGASSSSMELRLEKNARSGKKKRGPTERFGAPKPRGKKR